MGDWALSILFEIVEAIVCLPLVPFKKVLLGSNLLIAAHLTTVKAATSSLSPSWEILFLNEALFTIFITILSWVVNAVTFVRVILLGVDPGVLAFPGESLVACLSLAVVDELSDGWPSGHAHEEEANDHVAHCHDVVDGKVVAAHTQVSVVAWSSILLLLASCHLD